jgi:hypothetical protein
VKNQRNENTVLLLPVHNITNNREYDYLTGLIFNVLKINLLKQDTLTPFFIETNTSFFNIKELDFKELVKRINNNIPAKNCILVEYFVKNKELHMLVNVWDVTESRIKNSFTETMPADLDLLQNVEKISFHIAEAVALGFQLTERDMLFRKQVLARLRDQIDKEEKLVDTIINAVHEIQVAPGTGLHMGRTLVSWSPYGPFLSPAFAFEYSYYFSFSLHIRIGIEFLPFDLIDPESERREITGEVLFGFHTHSIFSFSIDCGIALIYDDNQHSAALSFTETNRTVYPEATRMSLSLPLKVGVSFFFNKWFFLCLRYNYNGLTWTFESQDPSSYDVGAGSYKYYYGVSPFNLLSMSIVLQTGFRL